MIFDFDVLDLLDETVFVSRYGFPSIFWVKIGFNYGKTVNFLVHFTSLVDIVCKVDVFMGKKRGFIDVLFKLVFRLGI